MGGYGRCYLGHTSHYGHGHGHPVSVRCLSFVANKPCAVGSRIFRRFILELSLSLSFSLFQSLSSWNFARARTALLSVQFPTNQLAKLVQEL